MLSRDGERVIEAMVLAALLALAVALRVDLGSQRAPSASSPGAPTALSVSFDTDLRTRGMQRTSLIHRNRSRQRNRLPMNLAGPFEQLGDRVAATIAATIEELSARGPYRANTRRC